MGTRGRRRPRLDEEIRQDRRRRTPSRDADRPSRWRVLVAGILVLVAASCSGLRSPERAANGAVGPIVLTWTTASEHESYGFHIYRARDADGPFERLNEEIIPAAGTSDVLRRYNYESHDADPEVVYYYFVESVSLQGERQRITPIRAFVRRAAAQDTGR